MGYPVLCYSQHTLPLLPTQSTTASLHDQSGYIGTYLLSFVHLSIRLTLILKDWIPTYDQLSEPVSRRQRFQHTEKARASGGHDSATSPSLEEYRFVARTSAVRKGTHSIGGLVIIRSKEIVKAFVAKRREEVLSRKRDVSVKKQPRQWFVVDKRQGQAML